MHLALDGARADRPPAHEIGKELPEGRVEKFGARRKSEIGKVGEKLAGEAQTLVDVIGTVQVGIVDQPFPSDDGARLLEVDAHEEKDAVLHALRELSQSLRVFDCGPGVVDRARTDDREKTRIAPVENGFDRASGARYAFVAARRDRNLLGQNRGR